jgi:hypothetical protein
VNPYVTIQTMGLKEEVRQRRSFTFFQSEKNWSVRTIAFLSVITFGLQVGIPRADARHIDVGSRIDGDSLIVEGK